MDDLKKEYDAFAEAMERNALEARADKIEKEAWARGRAFVQQTLEDIGYTEIARENLQDARENLEAQDL